MCFYDGVSMVPDRTPRCRVMHLGYPVDKGELIFIDHLNRLNITYEIQEGLWVYESEGTFREN